LTPGEDWLYWGWVAELAEVLIASFEPLLVLLPRPPGGFVGVTGVPGYLKAPSFVAVFTDDFDFDLMLSSFTCSSSNALEYFFDMILNLSFF
jgi:hypothetical protein